MFLWVKNSKKLKFLVYNLAMILRRKLSYSLLFMTSISFSQERSNEAPLKAIPIRRATVVSEPSTATLRLTQSEAAREEASFRSAELDKLLPWKNKNYVHGDVDALYKFLLGPENKLLTLDKKIVSFENAELAAHFFTLGPGGENFWNGELLPKIPFFVGHNCEIEKPLEFAVEWQRNKSGALSIESVGLHVGPSYRMKRKPKSKEKPNGSYALPETFWGHQKVNQFNVGKYSSAYTLESSKGKIQDLRTEWNPLKPTTLNYKIKYSDGRKKEQSIEIDKTHTVAGLVAMPFSLAFEKAGKQSILSRRYGYDPGNSGTYIHTSDAAGLTPRCSTNPGSGGCARVQSSYSTHLFQSAANLFKRHGGSLGESGLTKIREDDAYAFKKNKDGSDKLDENGQKMRYLNGQKLSEDEVNYRNLIAMLELRNKMSVEVFYKASYTELMNHYDNIQREESEAIFREIDSKETNKLLISFYKNSLNSKHPLSAELFTFDPKNSKKVIGYNENAKKLAKDLLSFKRANESYGRNESKILRDIKFFESKINGGSFSTKRKYKKIKSQAESALDQLKSVDKAALDSDWTELKETMVHFSQFIPEKALEGRLQKIAKYSQLQAEYMRAMDKDPSKIKGPLHSLDAYTLQQYRKEKNLKELYLQIAEMAAAYYQSHYDVINTNGIANDEFNLKACLQKVDYYRQKAAAL